MARDAGQVALATIYTPSYLRLMDTVWMKGALVHAAWLCLSQLARQQLKRPTSTPAPKCSCLEPFVCSCVLSGVVLSAQVGRGAVDMYG
jgi:hypothetical protein